MASSRYLRLASGLLPVSVKRRIKTRIGVPSVEDTLRRMQVAGFNAEVIIDVGAYRGDFTRLCRDVFPDAHCLMIEPLPGLQATLTQMTEQMTGVELRHALLGPEPAESVPFYENETVSSVLRESAGASGTPLRLPMMTLDEATEGTQFAHADLLKLDVQGFELEVLRGGGQTVAHAEAVLMEVNLLAVYEGAPLLADVVAYMDGISFRAYDICTFYRRPYDSALFEIDMMFVSKSSPLVASKRWQ